MVTYSRGVNYSGDAGDYCVECDTKLIQSQANPLHNAYRQVWRLRTEATAMWEEFNARAEEAEAAVKLFKQDK